MRAYETLVVLANDLASEQKSLMERFTAVITAGGGNLDDSHDWGSRKLAYPIKKQVEGHYYLLEYNAEPAVVSELERTLRITDGVLRYMSVQQEHTGLPKPRVRETERGDVPLHEMRGGGPGGYRPRSGGPEYGGRRHGEERGGPGERYQPAAAPAAAEPDPAAAPDEDSSEGVKTDE